MSKKYKLILFWGICLILTIERFIRYFIDETFNASFTTYLRGLPLFVKLICILVFAIFLYWVFPYKKKNLQNR